VTLSSGYFGLASKVTTALTSCLVPLIILRVYYNVTSMGDYRRGSGVDDWIYCTLYIHSSGLQAIERYS
jgi:hypothetical protein